MSIGKQTQAQRWLAEGHRYEDISLWRELCEWLEEHGLTHTTELPEHLAPLVFRDPENSYLAWLREELLTPVIHERSRPPRGGAERRRPGWRALGDWRVRLAVMRDPTPKALLKWWRELEPELRSLCLQRMTDVEIPVRDTFDVPIEKWTYHTVSLTYWHCTLCDSNSDHDDIRGIVHAWRKWNDKADCPLVRLHLKIREGERQAHPNRPRSKLAEDLHELAGRYVEIGHDFEGTFWASLQAHGWRDSDESSGTRILSRAAFHIAQSCLVWMEPNRLEMRKWAEYLRTCGDRPHGIGVDRYVRQAVEMYAEAATKLETMCS